MTVQNELLSEEEHRKIEELVEQEEGGVHRFASWWGTFLTAIAVAMIVYGLMVAVPLLVRPWGPKRVRLAPITGASDGATPLKTLDDRHLEPQPR